jgi:predicted transcriptional regulator
MKAIGTPYMLRAEVTAQSLVETDIADFRKLDEEAKSIQEKVALSSYFFKAMVLTSKSLKH